VLTPLNEVVQYKQCAAGGLQHWATQQAAGRMLWGCCGADLCPPPPPPSPRNTCCLPACLPACLLQPDSLCTRIGYCPASTPLFIS
jgi:hypothetical protein